MNAFEVLQARGLVQQYTAKVPEILAGEMPVTFYIGFDPTADSLHVGHLLPLMAMAHLQRAGHKPIAVLGGGTAMVGDPSFKDEMRAMLTEEQIAANLAGIRKQMDLVITFGEEGADHGPASTAGRLVNNAEWLCTMNYMHFLREVARHFSVNTMLTKASVKLRLEKGLSLLEFNYQVLQAYDFLELHGRYGCMLQMGGDDQWGNIVAGIDLIRRVNGGEAHGLTFPLLTTAEGKKMGKTAKGAVWLSAERLSPYEYFQYWVNVGRPGRGQAAPHLHLPAHRAHRAAGSPERRRHSTGQASLGLRGHGHRPRCGPGQEGQGGRKGRFLWRRSRR